MKSWLVAASLLMCWVQSACAAAFITQAWSRATAPGVTVGVIYADVVAEQDDELLAIETSVAARAELHMSSNDGGTMQMRRVQSVQLQPNKVVRFTPGAMHVMLIDLAKPLAAGVPFTVTFKFRHAPAVTVLADVLAPGQSEPAGLK